jgi:hypothetical protein
MGSAGILTSCGQALTATYQDSVRNAAHRPGERYQRHKSPCDPLTLVELPRKLVPSPQDACRPSALPKRERCCRRGTAPPRRNLCYRNGNGATRTETVPPRRDRATRRECGPLSRWGAWPPICARRARQRLVGVGHRGGSRRRRGRRSCGWGLGAGVPLRRFDWRTYQGGRLAYPSEGFEK